MTQHRRRSEEDLRAAFLLAAEDAPDRAAVLQKVYARGRPQSFARRYPVLAPVGAVAAVLLAVGIVVGIIHASGPGRTTASSADAAAGVAKAAATGSGYSLPSAPGSSEPAIGQGSVPAPESPGGTVGPSAGRTCRPDDLTLTLVWTETGSNLSGTLTAVNKSGSACDLLVAPTVVPLGPGNQPLTVRNVPSAAVASGPQRLLPGASTSAALTWSFWCERAVGASSQVSWGTGTATAATQHDPFTPTHQFCPQNTEASTMSSTYFSPLS